MSELGVAPKREEFNDCSYYTDIGRVKLYRKQQREGIVNLKPLYDENRNNKGNLKALFAGAAISGLFAIFNDGTNYFRIKNIPDNGESRVIWQNLGLEVYGSVESIKSSARKYSLASTDKRSNVNHDSLK